MNQNVDRPSNEQKVVVAAPRRTSLL